jgi:phage tail sheath protein FI
MLRICAARGDIFAVLGLPRAYDTGTTLLYRSQLAAAMFPEDGDRTLSFGGIYHSWLFVLDAAAGETVEAVRSVTPEGTICGTFAARTLDQGAWVSPANKVLKGVVNLDPHFSDDAALTFFNNQLNLVVQESEGFLSISSLTLSGEIDLVEINVRRLIILLRRLALREGTKDVFESNDIPFRRSVQRRFEDLLNNLFLRGAFAGAKADDSFLVRIDSSVNTPQTIAQGLFIVELSIAPSVPLEFLTVRLVQTGGDLQLAEQF